MRIRAQLAVLLLAIGTMASAQNEQNVPPFKTPYGNFTQGIKFNGQGPSFAGQCIVATGPGFSAWGACPGGIAGVASDGANGITVVGAVSTSSVNGVLFVKPSGDTTGGTDCGNIQAKCTAGASLTLAAATYYVGKSNATCTISNTCSIQGQGPASTVIQNEGTTNDVLVFNASNGTITGPPYANPFVSGGKIGGFRVQQDIGVTPSAGSCLRVGTNTFSGPVTLGYLFANMDLAGCYYNLRVDQGAWNDRFEQMTISNPIGSYNVYYDAPAPGGDNHFNHLFLEAPGSGAHPWGHFFINQADTNTDWTGIKINNGNFVFGSGGTGSSNIILSSIGVENGGASACAIDFTNGGTGTYIITNLEFEVGAGVHLAPYPVCNPSNPVGLILQGFIGNSPGSPGKLFNTATLVNPVTGNPSIYDNFASPVVLDLASTETNSVQPWQRFYSASWGGGISVTQNTNQLTSAGISSYYLQFNATPISPNYTASVNMTLGSSGAGWDAIFSRLNSVSSSTFNGYGCLFTQGSGIILDKFTNGTSTITQLGTTDTTFTGGTHTIGIIAQNNAAGTAVTLTCTRDGVSSAQATATDSSSPYLSAGFPGLAINNTTSGYTMQQPFTVQ